MSKLCANCGLLEEDYVRGYCPHYEGAYYLHTFVDRPHPTTANPKCERCGLTKDVHHLILAGYDPTCDGDFEPYNPEIFDECGGVRLDLIKPDHQQVLLDQYRKALENFGVTFADNGLIRKIPRTGDARYRNALTEILTLRSRHAKDCNLIAREALKGENL